MNELVITDYQKHKISAFFEDGKMTQVSAFSEEKGRRLGNIYVGRVDHIVKNINAAFVNIEEQCSCYLDLATARLPLFVRHQSENKICIGDEILVQLIKEEVKTKAPVVTTNFSLTGKYVILVHGGTGIQISKKILPKSLKGELKERLSSYAGDSYGIVVRTNAMHAKEQDVTEELKRLLAEYKGLKEHGVHQSKYSVLYQELPAYLGQLRDVRANKLNRIVTDQEPLLAEIQSYLSDYPCTASDGTPTMVESVAEHAEIAYRYRLNHFMDLAIRRVIYLNSGASLVIDRTEAMTVIDVNTGKAISGKKTVEQTFFTINLEAAREIAYQLRLRNLSGIILIDFINMEEEQHRTELMQELKRLFQEDPVQTELVDVTRLGLVEVTRKKVQKSLSEQLNEKEVCRA